MESGSEKGGRVNPRVKDQRDASLLQQKPLAANKSIKLASERGALLSDKHKMATFILTWASHYALHNFVCLKHRSMYTHTHLATLEEGLLYVCDTTIPPISS